MLTSTFDSCCCCRCNHLTVQSSGCACLPAQQPYRCCPVLRSRELCIPASEAGPCAIDPVHVCLPSRPPAGPWSMFCKHALQAATSQAASAMPCPASLTWTDPWSLHAHPWLRDAELCVGASPHCPLAPLRVCLAACLDGFRVAGVHCTLGKLCLPAPSQTQPLPHTILRPRLGPGAGSILLIMHHFLQHTGHMRVSGGQGAANIACSVPS